MKKFFTFHILLLEIFIAQELPFGKPKYFEMEIETNIPKIDVQVPASFPFHIISSIKPYEFDNKDIYFIELQLNDNIPFHFKLINPPLPNGMTLYFKHLLLQLDYVLAHMELQLQMQMDVLQQTMQSYKFKFLLLS